MFCSLFVVQQMQSVRQITNCIVEQITQSPAPDSVVIWFDPISFAVRCSTNAICPTNNKMALWNKSPGHLAPYSSSISLDSILFIIICPTKWCIKQICPTNLTSSNKFVRQIGIICPTNQLKLNRFCCLSDKMCPTNDFILLDSSEKYNRNCSAKWNLLNKWKSVQ